jgi:hypothetical protein
MPVIPSLVLTNQNPVITYTASVLTSGSVLSDGLGNQLTSLQLTSSYSNTSSYAVTSSLSVISYYDYSGSFASQSMWSVSSSFATKSIWTDSSSFASQSISSSWSNFALNTTSSGLVGLVTNDVSASHVTASTFAIPSNLFNVDVTGSVVGWNLIVNQIDSDSHIIKTDSMGNITAYGITASLYSTASQATIAQTASLASTASQAISSSFSTTSSYFSPSQGTVIDAGPLTGSVSASGYGFTTDVEFNNFVTSVSSSLQQFNTLLTYLRSAGIIS